MESRELGEKCSFILSIGKRDIISLNRVLIKINYSKLHLCSHEKYSHATRPLHHLEGPVVELNRLSSELGEAAVARNVLNGQNGNPGTWLS